MRRLCFRVWDKNKKKFIIPEMHFIGEYSVIAGGLATQLRPYGVMDLNDLVVSQYAGVTDYSKKRKDIYEGDIVELTFHDGQKIKRVVTWDEHGAQFFFRNMSDPDDETLALTFLDSCLSKIRVIGNIFEKGMYKEQFRITFKSEASLPKASRAFFKNNIFFDVLGSSIIIQSYPSDNQNKELEWNDIKDVLIAGKIKDYTITMFKGYLNE